MSKKRFIAIILTILLFIIFGIKIKSNLSASDDVKDQLKVSVQQINNKVFIDKVILSKPGFVVVREVVEGKLGQILEVSKYLSAGKHKDVVINLPDIPDSKVDVIALLYRDNGDEGFNPTQDILLIKDEGGPIAYSLLTGKPVSMSVFSPTASLSRGRNEAQALVVYDGEKYIPDKVEISVGDTVVFKNESDNKLMWTASDPHPAHTDLSTFDQFGTVGPGEEYRYTFTKVGRWGFHNHVNPTATGTVTVTDE